MSILESITNRFSSRRAKNLTEYAELVAATLDGREVDPDRAADILERGHKSPEALAADVKLLQDRRRWAADIAAGKQADADLQAILADEQRIEAERAAANARFDEMRRPLTLKKYACAQVSGKAAEAKDRLRETAAAVFDEQAREIGKRGLALQTQIHALAEMRSRNKQIITGLTARLDGPESDAKAVQAEIEQRKTRIRELDGQIAALEASRAAVNEELEEVERRKLDPLPSL